MDFNSSDYYRYKRNKIQRAINKQQEQPSRFTILLQIFAITFIIFFIAIVVSIMKLSTKIDIEYSNSKYMNNNGQPEQQEYDEEDEIQGKIDKRLTLIQQEENAPSEAKIIRSNDFSNSEVINPVHLEENKKIEKAERLKKLKEAQEAVNKTEATNQKEAKKDNNEETQKPTTLKIPDKLPLLEKKAPIPEINTEKNITINSKVLIGHYKTFEDAREAQIAIKQKTPSSTPYVRKIGEAYSLQMGSYQEFSTARIQAQKLKAQGYDVWIYQQ